MSRIKEFFKRYFILSKRLLFKKSFVAILVFVPLLVGAVELAVSHGDSGIVTVALAMEDNEDELAREIVDELTDDDALIRFIICDTPDEAAEGVKTGKADAAWIFSADLERRIEKFVNHTHNNNAFVTVIQRETNMFLDISTEKLNAVLYPRISEALFLENGKYEVSGLTDEQMIEFYKSVNAEGGDLFDFVYASANGEDEIRGDEEVGFLVSPLRGLLAMMVVLGGVAVAMFYMNDELQGTFDRFPRSTGFSFSVAYHSSAVFMVAIVMLAAIFVMRISRGAGYEILVLVIYSVAVVGFSMCLRLILRDIRFFGALAPILIIVMAVVCPILYPAPNLPVIQYLMPPYYYLRSMTDVTFLWYMTAYGVASCVIAFLLHRFGVTRRRR